MAEQHDVVIVGAGLVGLSVAYHLAQRGIRDVLVLEREATYAQGSSGRSAGGVRLEFSHPSAVRFSQYGLHVLEHFEDEFGVSPQFRACGYLFVTSDPARWAGLQESAAMQHQMGVPVEALDAEAIRPRFAYISFPDLAGGIYGPRDGVGDPAGVAAGYIRRARQLGVEVRFHAHVEGITTAAGRVTGIRTASGLIGTSTVVNAAGPQARRLAKWRASTFPSRHIAGPSMSQAPLTSYRLISP